MTIDITPDNATADMTDRDLMLMINAKLDHLMEAHNDMVAKVNNIIEEISPHIDKIGPVVDQIANSPMLKMFGGRKKD